MTASRSDALVLFGVTGDLAHKMIFPALYAMAKRGALKVPIIGVASPTMGALLETWYQWSEPFVTDSALTERTFGLSATPIDVAAVETVAWWRSRSAGGATVDASAPGSTSHSVHIGATRG